MKDSVLRLAEIAAEQCRLADEAAALIAAMAGAGPGEHEPAKATTAQIDPVWMNVRDAARHLKKSEKWVRTWAPKYRAYRKLGESVDINVAAFR